MDSTILGTATTINPILRDWTFKAQITRYSVLPVIIPHHHDYDIIEKAFDPLSHVQIVSAHTIFLKILIEELSGWWRSCIGFIGGLFFLYSGDEFI